MRVSVAAALCAAVFRFRRSVAWIVPGTTDNAVCRAADAVAEAIAACAKQGYKVTATLVDTDGVTQATLRGDGASMTTLGAARDKAYTSSCWGSSATKIPVARSRSA